MLFVYLHIYLFMGKNSPFNRRKTQREIIVSTCSLYIQIILVSINNNVVCHHWSPGIVSYTSSSSSLATPTSPSSGCGLSEWYGREGLMRGRGRRHLIHHLHTSSTDWSLWRPDHLLILPTIPLPQLCHLIGCVAGGGYAFL